MRLEHPQAMLLVVPNGKVKLLNALPFAAGGPAPRVSRGAWNAYREHGAHRKSAQFIERCRAEPGLLRHANETWAMA